MTMDLILWRHAEAEDLNDPEVDSNRDLSRRLTHRGEKQAARMAAWLDRQLPEGVKVLCSPAVRAEQTVLALGRKYRVREELGPERSADDLLKLVQWTQSRQSVLVVGHQPVLGQVVARLLGMQAPECSIRKGTVWWLRYRERHGKGQTVLLTVQTPDLI